jgi:hypothetical protein
MTHNNINSPKHYAAGKIEVIEAIEDWKLGFNLGNSIKYIARAGKKDPSKHAEDLKKAIWYLNRELGLVVKNTEVPQKESSDERRSSGPQ